MPSLADIKQKRKELRQLMRQQRRQIDDKQQQEAAQALAHSISKHPAFLAARHLAFYMPGDGEIDPRPLIKIAQQQGKLCYLPVLQADSKTLLFTRFDNENDLVLNFYGLLEPVPDKTNTIATKDLDLVLLPLVAFDAHGTRLGMGGGYYDRSFAFLKQQARSPGDTPLLMGVAHDCQRVEKLELAEWDIPMQEIMSDRHHYRASPRQ